MNAYDVLSQRAVGELPISIGTALALEGLEKTLALVILVISAMVLCGLTFARCTVTSTNRWRISADLY